MPGGAGRGSLGGGPRGRGPGEGQEVGLLVVLEVKVVVKALGFLAFWVVSGTEKPLEVAQEDGL